jgi:predicted neuraminidase
MELTRDFGQSWTRTENLNDGKTIEAIQPTFFYSHGAAAQPIGTLCRTQQGKLAASSSSDGGKTWQPLTLTDLPNPDSGIDATALADGRGLLVYNPTQRGRTPLIVATTDDYRIWRRGPTLESQPGEYSYPAVIQTTDGQVHITYTWKRQKIRHAVLDPAQFKLGDLPKSQ